MPDSSFYAQYLKERTNDLIVEIDYGFATYRYLDDGKTVYIVDIFVVPAYRQDGYARMMADRIVKEAKAKGCKKLIGTVVPSAKGSNISLKVLLGYKMTLDSATNDLIVFKKDL